MQQGVQKKCEVNFSLLGVVPLGGTLSEHLSITGCDILRILALNLFLLDFQILQRFLLS